MLRINRTLSLRGFSVAALILTLLLSPLYLAGRPDSSPRSAQPLFPATEQRTVGDPGFMIDNWEEQGTRYLRLSASFSTATQTSLSHDVVAADEIIVDQVSITGGPFETASEARGLFYVGDLSAHPHFFTYTPNDTRTYDLAHPLMISEGDQIVFAGFDSTGDSQSVVITFIGRPLPPSGMTVQ